MLLFIILCTSFSLDY